ncbi:MAG: prepilin-type N-terminal cleavage/methylation domain-containing protein [Vicinamibacteria bacterium]|jgi:prepilin-type N-terminal cleavage/methylation domain-containing protein|nr:prepilin-type N-terminal cleavage/methylation domain-containing protein [Vicinamibacteria bacterium]
MKKEYLQHNDSSQAGFTLVETLIAIVVLVFGLVAVTNLLIVGSVSNTVANHSSAATAIAIETMESLKNVSFQDLPTANAGDLESDSPSTNSSDVIPTSFTAGAFYNTIKDVPGVGIIKTRWRIDLVDAQLRFIIVRSWSTSPLVGSRSRIELTSFRSCTEPEKGCPTL